MRGESPRLSGGPDALGRGNVEPRSMSRRDHIDPKPNAFFSECPVTVLG
jgi:hypothetical protein